MKASDPFTIIRPINALMGVVGTVISAFIALGWALPDYYPEVIISSLSVFLVTSGGNILNDVVDIETDRINHPERPLPGGRMSKKFALSYMLILFVIAPIISGIWLNRFAFLIVILAEILLILYEFRAKRYGISGNIIIGLLVGLIFVFGGVAVGSYYKMLILFAMASLTNVGREITKDVEDIGGDLDRMTFPRTHGVRKSFHLTSGLVLVAVIISVFPYLTGIFSVYYLIAVALSDSIFIYSIVLFRRDVSSSQRYSKIAMIAGLLSFVVGEVL